jgi:cytochrome c biogenesis protein ResB
LVQIPGGHDVVISMNEPLKYNGYTFYQSSFERDERTGKPAISILSVNYDPGRWIKYLGSMLMVLGSIILFYFKRVQWLKSR